MNNIKKIYSGDLLANNIKFAIVIARWHEVINEKLLAGAIDTIKRHGGSEENIEIIYVPGSLEIPLTLKQLAETKKYDAIIALGTIIRGKTLHFDLIANEVFKASSSISLEHNLPITVGVLTTDNFDQAIERAGGKAGNKGVEATLAAIEMVNLKTQIAS